MKYTVRFAHLKYPSPLRPGQVVYRGEEVGVMGDTGSSNGAHVHLDVVEGTHTGRYTLADMAAGSPKPNAKQCVFFADEELFNYELVVTVPYADPPYYKRLAKFHFAMDVVPEDRHRTTEHHKLRWPRSMPGTVVRNVEGDPAYGNYVMITYEAS